MSQLTSPALSILWGWLWFRPAGLRISLQPRSVGHEVRLPCFSMRLHRGVLCFRPASLVLHPGFQSLGLGLQVTGKLGAYVFDFGERCIPRALRCPEPSDGKPDGDGKEQRVGRKAKRRGTPQKA